MGRLVMSPGAKKLVLSGLLLTLSAMVPKTAAALQPHERNGWMFGVSLGYGSGDVILLGQGDDRELLDVGWQSGVIPEIRLGRMLGHRLMLSFENKQWLNEQAAPEVTDEIIKLRSNVQSFAFALTYFPGSPTAPAGGLYFKAGAGWSNGRFTVLVPTTEEEKEESGGDTFKKIYKNDDTGFAWFGEMGYEFRVFRSFAPGVAVTYSDLGFNDPEVYDSVKTIGVVLSMNWYF